MVTLCAQTEDGVSFTVSGPGSSFPYAEHELTLSLHGVESGEKSVYAKSSADVGFFADELQEKEMRVFELSLLHDGCETYLKGLVTVTVQGLADSESDVYRISDGSETWIRIASVFTADDGAVRFETDTLGLTGFKTAERSPARRVSSRGSAGSEPDTLTVHKVWTDGVGAHTSDEIEVKLWFDDGVNDPVLESSRIISAADNWTYTFTLQNPMEENGRLQYSLSEDVPGYYTQYGVITKAPEPDYLQGWWVPADTLENGETYVFVSSFNGNTYAPATTDENSAMANFYALPVTVVQGAFTVNGTQYNEYLIGVEDWATFDAEVQTSGGFLLKNRFTQRFFDPRGYCPQSAQQQGRVIYANGKIRSAAAVNGKIWWLRQYSANGVGNSDYTGSDNENGGTPFSLYKLIPGESVNAYVTTITNKLINPHQGGIEGTDSPEIYKTIDWLGDDGNNTDTALRGEDFYRLYLDVRATAENRPVDLLLVLDNSGSMFTPSLVIDGKLRNEILLEILEELIPDFLSANPGNRISHVYFSGPASYYNSPASVPTNVTSGNVSDDAWLSQEWTGNAAAAVNSLERSCRFVNNGSGGGTNYSQGLAAARVQIDKSIAAGRTTYVIFFSDGVPTYYIKGSQRGGNGFDTAGKSIQSTFYNVSKKNVEACRQPTLDAIAAFKAAYPGVTMSAVGFSSLVQETHVSIMTQMPYNGGFYQHATDTSSLREALTAAFSAAAVSNVTITDELSPYVQIPTSDVAGADYKVTMTEIASGMVTALYKDGAVTQAGQGIVESLEYTAGNNPSSTGTVQLKFAEEYVLDSKYRYTLSFNVEVTPKAYEEFANNGYGGVTGDLDTDYLPAGNETSSEKPGFHSNKIAYVDYKLNGTEYTDYYAYPVVQVRTQSQTAELTVTKSVLGGDLTESFSFEVIFRDPSDQVITDVPAGEGYTVDSETGVVSFSLAHGQSVTFGGLPIGTVAEIREIGHDGYVVIVKEGNQTLFTGDSGSVALNEDRIITVVNNAGAILPETGGSGTYFYVVGGAAIMLGALIYGCRTGGGKGARKEKGG